MRTSIRWLIFLFLLLPLMCRIAAAAPAASPRDEAGDGPAVDRATDRATDRAADAGELTGPRIAVRGPTVGAVLAAAYAAAGLAHDPGDSWIRRARIAGLVPWVTVRTTRDTSWQDESAEVGHATALELRATWRLDRLLFDARELQVASLETARHRERRRLAARVIRAYFTWRRAASIASDDERAIARAAEAAAELDALTDGWFSDQLSPHGAGSARP